MNRGHWIIVSIVVLVVAGPLASCAASAGPVARPVERTDVPRPSDPDIALVWIGDPDGFPSVVIAADGWVYTPDDGARGDGASDDSKKSQGRSGRAVHPLAAGSTASQAIAPLPPEPTPVSRRLLTPAGVQMVLDLAAELHLLEVPGPSEDPGVTDHGTTYVTLRDGEGTYRHAAYALGSEEERGNRRDLQKFVEAVEEVEALESVVGADNLGPPQPYVPDLFHVSVTSSYGAEAETTWPAGILVSEGCVALPVDVFSDGVSGVYVADIGGEQVRVTVVPDLPGGPCT